MPVLCLLTAGCSRAALATQSRNAQRFQYELTEIQEAVKELTPGELTKLAAYITRQDKLGWDEQIEADFAPDGKHAVALQRLDAEIDAGSCTPLP